VCELASSKTCASSKRRPGPPTVKLSWRCWPLLLVGTAIFIARLPASFFCTFLLEVDLKIKIKIKIKLRVRVKLKRKLKVNSELVETSTPKHTVYRYKGKPL